MTFESPIPGTKSSCSSWNRYNFFATTTTQILKMEAQTPTTMQPVRALILLLVAFVGFLAAFPAERQWQNAKFPRRAALLMKRREEQALRNCFFSPVQCLLPINDKALRKFVPHN
ncbi:hypothetical protein L596_019315 [Steinernema carpocapsae]|uniref:Uncharacterized protein n=1 Tax=Steinernema carpocapsae TaxID=34508 RepID=A0A4U5MQ60_STECR|nr:hypothetical protein L596_019315 [Steinernema carpocapsae]